MKILHFISAASSGGAENLVRDLSISMTKEGHSVAIVFLDTALEQSRSLDYEKKFLQYLVDNNIEYFFLGSSCRKNIIKGFYRFYKIINIFKPDIIHCHLFYSLLFSLPFIFYKHKIVYTHHSIFMNVTAFIFKILTLRVSRLISICNACHEKLSLISKIPMTKIFNGVDPSRLISPSSSYNNENFNFVFVGRLTAAKNLDLLIDSVQLIKDKEFTVTIAGEGELFNYIQNKINFLGLNQKIFLVGNVSDISTILKAADVFIMSSAWEGLPISLLEATLLNIPSIVTNVGGCAEVSHLVNCGIVVDSMDPKEYSSAMLKLLEDKILLDNFRRNSAIYSHVFTINNCTTKHLDLYNSLLSE